MTLQEIIKALVAPRKGILAADESVGTMGKRLAAINVESTPKNRSMWREIMVTSTEVEKAISGLILFDETLRNPLPNGKMITDILKEKNILSGIKVDKGTVKFNSDEETYTLGLDGLVESLIEYKKMGASFTKWRATYKVSDLLPSSVAITVNSIGLAQYALMVQKIGLVPIVEPEVLVLEGSHDLKRSAEVTELVLKDVFKWLKDFGVRLDSMLLKPNMVLPGKDSQKQSSAEEIAAATVQVFRATVPDLVPGIVFLSGGLTPDQATEYLKTMNQANEKTPWRLSYSFGRALQQEGLTVWGGREENIKKAQEVFLHRAKKVSEATV